MYWPKVRQGHASAIIASDQHTAMVVIGGDPAFDSCIYDFNSNIWQEVCVYSVIYLLLL